MEVPKLNIANLTELSYHSDQMKFDEDLQSDYDELITIKNRTKLAACLILIKNSLAKGNNDVIKTLKETKHDKEKTYDKIVAMMTDSCYNKIDKVTIEKVENIYIILDIKTRGSYYMGWELYWFDWI